MSREINSDEELAAARALLKPLPSFHTDFATFFSSQERKTNRWKNLNKPQLEAIRSNYHGVHNTPEHQVKVVDEMLLQQLLRVHIEVEGYHLASFSPRVNQLPPRQLKAAVDSFGLTPQDAITTQQDAPLGIFSPYLWDAKRRQKAAAMLQTTPREVEAWETFGDPSVQFPDKDKHHSDWKKLTADDLKELVKCYMEDHDLKGVKHKERVHKVVVMEWFQVHCDVERLHQNSFYNRIHHMTLDQLDEAKEWLVLNCNKDLSKEALEALDDDELECKHEPLGADSQLITSSTGKEWIYKVLAKLFKGETLPDDRDSSNWITLPNQSKEWLKATISAVWQDSLPQDPQAWHHKLKLMTDGFLRIHTDVERQPFETFYPRFYTTDPQTWEETLNFLKDFCAPEALGGSS